MLVSRPPLSPKRSKPASRPKLVLPAERKPKLLLQNCLLLHPEPMRTAWKG
jgi:hypothetical protein